MSTTAKTTEGVNYATIPAMTYKWLWEPFYPLGEVTLNVAAGGTGKTTEMADVTARVTTGADMPDGRPGGPPASVIWVTLEDGPGMLKWKFLAAGADASKIYDLSYVDGQPFYLDGTRSDSLAALETTIREVGDVRLVVIDTLRKASRLRLTDEINAQRILLPLIKVARETGVAIVANHHTTKSGSVAGSGALVDTVRHTLMLENLDDSGLIEVRIHKTNITDRDVEPAYYEIEGEPGQARAVWVGEDAETYTSGKAETLVLGALDDGPLTEQQITAATGVPYGTVRVIIEDLTTRGAVSSPAHELYEAASGNSLTIQSATLGAQTP